MMEKKTFLYFLPQGAAVVLGADWSELEARPTRERSLPHQLGARLPHGPVHMLMGVSQGRLCALMGAALHFRLSSSKAGELAPLPNHANLAEPGLGEQQPAVAPDPCRVLQIPLPLSKRALRDGHAALGVRREKQGRSSCGASLRDGLSYSLVCPAAVWQHVCLCSRDALPCPAAPVGRATSMRGTAAPK